MTRGDRRDAAGDAEALGWGKWFPRGDGVGIFGSGAGGDGQRDVGDGVGGGNRGRDTEGDGAVRAADGGDAERARATEDGFGVWGQRGECDGHMVADAEPAWGDEGGESDEEAVLLRGGKDDTGVKDAQGALARGWRWLVDQVSA